MTAFLVNLINSLQVYFFFVPTIIIIIMNTNNNESTEVQTLGVIRMQL